jgi:peptide/nickel transport system substrate-binding protein
VLAAACSGGPTPSRGTVVVGIRGDVDAWNPYVSADATSAMILDLLYPRLVREVGFGPGESGFEPWLATSWARSPDGREITFHLRQDAVWSDGHPVTCEDVRFTHGAQIAPAMAWPGAFIKARILAVECPDPTTARFRFREAYADQMLDANDDAIVPASYGRVPFESWRATAWNERAITCGPFRVGPVSPGQEAVLVRDATWWGAGDTRIETVILRVYPDAGQAVGRFLEGGLHVLPKFPPLRAAEAALRQDLELVDLPSLSFAYLGWNVLEPEAYVEERARRGCGTGGDCGPDDLARLRRERPHPILADARVRRALTHAIDRHDLVDGLFGGHAVPGSSPIVSTLWAHDPRAALPYDRERAAALLAEAGWTRRGPGGLLERDGRPLQIQVIVNADNQVRRDALARVAASLAALGVRLVEESLPRAEFVARARDKRFDVVLGGWVAGSRIEPQALLHARAAANRGNNITSWSTAESDALLDQAAAAPSRDDAGPLWRRWQEIFRDEQPVTVLFEERALLGRSRRVRGAVPAVLNPFAGLPVWRVE